MSGTARSEASGADGAQAAADLPIRDAASLILVRRQGGAAQVLMGQRGAKAAFMPSKFVFPGGAVDPEDIAFAPEIPIAPATERRLSLHADPAVGRALALTGIRELLEETGLALARADPDAARLAARAPPTLRPLLERGMMPDARALRFVFRAITPPGRPRRFDARFFLGDAAGLAGDTNDFTAACGELDALQWIDLPAARALPLPFVTEVVLSEIEALLEEDLSRARPVPFFHHGVAGSFINLI